MIIQKLKISGNILSSVLLIVCLLVSCNEQKELQNEIQIKMIVEGVIVENFHNYVFSDDPNSVYIAGKDTVSVRYISEYDNTGNIIRFLIHKPEGPLKYSIEELITDTALFNYTGGKNVKDWKFVSNNKIINKTDTLEVETTENSFGKQILVNRKGNSVIIFELSHPLSAMAKGHPLRNGGKGVTTTTIWPLLKKP